MGIRKFRDSDAVPIAKMVRDTIRTVDAKDYNEQQIREWSAEVRADKFKRRKDLWPCLSTWKKEDSSVFELEHKGRITGLCVGKTAGARGRIKAC